MCIFPWLHASSHFESLCPRAYWVYVCIYTYMYAYMYIYIYVYECAHSMCVCVLYLCMYVRECAHLRECAHFPKFVCRHCNCCVYCCVPGPVVYTHVFIHSVYVHVCIHLWASIDWCCCYYFVRNSLVALLEALCARLFSSWPTHIQFVTHKNSLVALLEALCVRYVCVYSIYIFMCVGGCVYPPEFVHHHLFDSCVREPVVYTHVLVHSIYIIYTPPYVYKYILQIYSTIYTHTLIHTNIYAHVYTVYAYIQILCTNKKAYTVYTCAYTFVCINMCV